MKKVLIYDADCPLCRAYTKGLVLTGALPAEDRVTSHAITDPALIDRLDPVRQRHEIPFVDLDTGEAQYGVEAILTITQGRWPRFTRFLRDTLLFELGKRFYAFVSYNRRLLFPAPPERPHLMDLTPDFDLGYRIGFLVLLFGTLLTGHLAATGSVAPLAAGTLVTHLLLTGGYILRHSSTTRLANVLDYLGHLGMSLLLGGIVKSIGFAVGWPALLLVGDALMLWQHVVRLRVMRLPDYLNLPFALFVLLNG